MYKKVLDRSPFKFEKTNRGHYYLVLHKLKSDRDKSENVLLYFFACFDKIKRERYSELHFVIILNLYVLNILYSHHQGPVV